MQDSTGTKPASPPGLVLLSDPHANLVALEAVLEDAAPLVGRGYGLVTLGDLVGMGPRPQELIARVRALPGVLHVRGNNDRYIGLREYEREIFHRDVYEAPPPGLRDNLRWTREALDGEGIDFLLGQPERLELEFAGRPLLAVHGGLDSDEQPTVPERVDEAFAARLPDRAILVTGHTHRPFVREIAGRLVLNAGGCGSSLDGDPRAAYAVLHAEEGRARAEIRRVAFDLDAVAEDLKERRAPWRETIVAVMRAAGMPKR